MIDDERCDCDDDDRRRPLYELVAAAKEAKDAQVSALERVGYGALTVIGVVATAAAILIPADGPAGDIAAGTATARAAAATIARSGLTAAGSQAARARAAAMMNTIFRGSRLSPTY